MDRPISLLFVQDLVIRILISNADTVIRYLGMTSCASDSGQSGDVIGNNEPEPLRRRDEGDKEHIWGLICG